MQTFQLAVIHGDGIGPEVTSEALKVLEQVSSGSEVKFESTRYDLGAERYLATGEVLPDSVLAEVKQHDAILLGAEVVAGGLELDVGLRGHRFEHLECLGGDLGTDAVAGDHGELVGLHGRRL